MWSQGLEPLSLLLLWSSTANTRNLKHQDFGSWCPAHGQTALSRFFWSDWWLVSVWGREGRSMPKRAEPQGLEFSWSSCLSFHQCSPALGTWESQSDIRAELGLSHFRPVLFFNSLVQEFGYHFWTVLSFSLFC